MQRNMTRLAHCLLIKGIFIGLIYLPLNTSMAAELQNDVRVLIDVSGSMKQTDPNNLRTPALKLLVGLLPNGTRAGVWTFGQYVNMQVKLGKVDAGWKANAQKEAARIHSRGLFTNLEGAIEKATADWQKRDPRYRRSVILLTDGMVDLSKDTSENAASRKRLLEDVLHRLHESEVTIHTIALSDQADMELLRSLSMATDGRFEQADTADKLKRVFLHMFEKSVATDTLPLAENRFTVDKSINDFTVLAFHETGAKATRIVDPAGKTWSLDNHPKTFKWVHENGYDLITVKSPKVGEWKLESQVDPDNRVMIVTNLRLKVDKLPNNLLIGEDALFIRARLLEDGKTITPEALRELTRFSVSLSREAVNAGERTLEDKGNDPDILKGDGVYSGKISQFKLPGIYELLVKAEGKTFSREIRHTVDVVSSPVSLRIHQEGDKYRLAITASSGMLRPDSLSMQLSWPDGKRQIVQQEDVENWSLDIPAERAGQTFTLTVVGVRYNDKPFKMDFRQKLQAMPVAEQLMSVLEQTAVEESVVEPVSQPAQGPVETNAQQMPSKEAPQAEGAVEPGPEEKHSTEDAPNKDEDPAAPVTHKAGLDWIRISIYAVIANLLLGLIGGGVYIFLRKRRAKTAAAEEQELQV